MLTVSQNYGIPCAVCHQDLTCPTLRLNDCGHNIHKTCYEILEKSKCPTCNIKIIKVELDSTANRTVHQLHTIIKKYDWARRSGPQLATQLFYHGIETHNFSCVRQLLRNRLVSLSVIYKNISPIFAAVYTNNDQAAAYFIKKGADLQSRNFNIRDFLINPSLITAAVRSGRIQIVQILINKGVDVNNQNEDGYTPLHAAAQSTSDVVLTKRLLANGAEKSLNALWLNAWTPLAFAIEAGNVDNVKTLVEAGADLSITYEGHTPLEFARKTLNDDASWYQSHPQFSKKGASIIKKREFICEYLLTVPTIAEEMRKQEMFSEEYFADISFF
jgi:ankyrin repeat protein